MERSPYFFELFGFVSVLFSLIFRLVTCGILIRQFFERTFKFFISYRIAWEAINATALQVFDAVCLIKRTPAASASAVVKLEGSHLGRSSQHYSFNTI